MRQDSAKVFENELRNNGYATSMLGNGEIVTLFKPEKGLDYWNKQVELYG